MSVKWIEPNQISNGYFYFTYHDLLLQSLRRGVTFIYISRFVYLWPNLTIDIKHWNKAINRSPNWGFIGPDQVSTTLITEGKSLHVYLIDHFIFLKGLIDVYWVSIPSLKEKHLIWTQLRDWIKREPTIKWAIKSSSLRQSFNNSHIISIRFSYLVLWLTYKVFKCNFV